MMTASFTMFVVSIVRSSYGIQYLIDGLSVRIASLSQTLPCRHTVDLHPVDDFKTYHARRHLGDPIHVVLNPRNVTEYSPDQEFICWIALAKPKFPLVFMFPVLFSGARGDFRRSLSEVTIMAGTRIGNLFHGLAQILTHELSHCYLNTDDTEYNWDDCAFLAANPLPGVDPLDNADTVAGIVIFPWYLFHKPEWDSSTGKAVRRLIPEWVLQFRQGIIREQVVTEPQQIERRVLRLRSREIVWRLQVAAGAVIAGKWLKGGRQLRRTSTENHF